MESIFDSIYSVNERANMLNSESKKVSNCFSLLNDAIYESIRMIDEFDHALDNLSAHVKLSASNDVAEKTFKEQYQQAEILPINNADTSRVKDKSAPNGNEGLDALQKSTEAIGRILGKFRELPPALDKLNKGLEITSELTGGIKGLETLLHAGTKTSLIEELVAGVDVITGIESLTGAATMFGPWGIVAAGGLATAELAYNEIKREELLKEHLKIQEEISKKSIATFEITESGANDYIKQIDGYGKAEQHRWHLNYNPVKENIKAYGPHAYNLNNTFPSIVSKADNVLFHSSIPAALLQVEEDKPKINASYLEQTTKTQSHLLYAALSTGISGFQAEALKAVARSKDYDKIHSTQSTQMVISAIKETASFVFNEANAGKEVPDINLQPGRSKSSRYEERSLPGNGKIIHINLNKPMIGNFTVYTKDIKDGVDSLKHEVEEVLLEILNSANVI